MIENGTDNSFVDLNQNVDVEECTLILTDMSASFKIIDNDILEILFSLVGISSWLSQRRKDWHISCTHLKYHKVWTSLPCCLTLFFLRRYHQHLDTGSRWDKTG